MASKKTLNKYLDHLKKALSEVGLDSAFDQIERAIGGLKESASDSKKSKKLDISDLPAPQGPSDFLSDFALFSDGACRGNPGPGAWGNVIQNSVGEVLSYQAKFVEDTTNNRMELLGVIEGLKSLGVMGKERGMPASDMRVWIFSDSQYVVKGVNEWVAGWKARGWKKADNKAPENVDLWQLLDQLNGKFKKLHYNWVKGHAGHPQNEFCDQIANEALDEAGH